MYPAWLSRVLAYGLLPAILAALVWTVIVHPAALPAWSRLVVLGGAGGYCVSLLGDVVRLFIRCARRSDVPSW